jgi:TFIIH basal transcription factor complex TTD-A subunit
MSAKRGELIECSDPAIREYILWVNASQPETKQFVIKDLPPVHLFVKRECATFLKLKVNQLIDKNTFLEENR